MTVKELKNYLNSLPPELDKTVIVLSSGYGGTDVFSTEDFEFVEEESKPVMYIWTDFYGG